MLARQKEFAALARERERERVEARKAEAQAAKDAEAREARRAVREAEAREERKVRKEAERAAAASGPYQPPPTSPVEGTQSVAPRKKARVDASPPVCLSSDDAATEEDSATEEEEEEEAQQALWPPGVEACNYGATCYRANTKHMMQFAHPCAKLMADMGSWDDDKRGPLERLLKAGGVSCADCKDFGEVKALMRTTLTTLQRPVGAAPPAATRTVASSKRKANSGLPPVMVD